MSLRPMILGGLMGLMMMGMLHLMLTGETTLGGAALGMFVLVHLALIAALVGASIFAARLSAPLRAKMARLHRPDLRHVPSMVVSAVLGAIFMHLFIHGGF